LLESFFICTMSFRENHPWGIDSLAHSLPVDKFKIWFSNCCFTLIHLEEASRQNFHHQRLFALMWPRHCPKWSQIHNSPKWNLLNCVHIYVQNKTIFITCNITSTITTLHELLEFHYMNGQCNLLNVIKSE
jgi:hypothetical protein